MLDVHPAHHAAGTWRDFFIHVGTICVGLLIAVGLEQTVEFFHHRHQQHQLEEQLHTELLQNMNVALQNMDAFGALQSSLIAQYTELQAAAREHRSPQVLRPTFGPGNTYPKTAAWVVAQQNATLGLLPGTEAQLWVGVYRATDRVSTAMLDEWNVRETLYAAQVPARLFDATDPNGAQASSFDYSRMTSDQLRILSDRLADVITSDTDCIYRNRSLYALDWAVWHGITSEDAIRRVAGDALNIAGGKAGMLGRYPLPKEAKHLTTTEGDR
jgi:hypothetical protein